MTFATLTTLMHSHDVHTLLVSSDNLYFLHTMMNGSSCVKKSWLGLNIHKSVGLFGAHALGFDAALSYYDGHLELWFGDQRIVSQSWNLPNGKVSPQDVLKRVQQEDVLWQELKKRHAKAICTLSPWLTSNNSMHSLSTETLLPHLYPNKILQVTNTHELHPEQDGWKLIDTATGQSYSNQTLFTLFSDRLTRRKRGEIVNMTAPCRRDKSQKILHESLLDACKNTTVLAGFGRTGQWIVRENYFAYHDPLWQLSCTLRAVQEIIH